MEGREVGFAKGFEVGQEMGFYAGCHAVWARCVAEDPECFTCLLYTSPSPRD